MKTQKLSINSEQVYMTKRIAKKYNYTVTGLNGEKRREYRLHAGRDNSLDNTVLSYQIRIIIAAMILRPGIVVFVDGEVSVWLGCDKFPILNKLTPRKLPRFHWQWLQTIGALIQKICSSGIE